MFCPWWPPSCQSPGGISHWRGSEQCRGDSGTNTALSSHCHSRSPWARAAAYSNRHEFRSWWQLVFLSSFPVLFLDFCLQQIFALRRFTLSSSVQREKLLCDCSSLPVERRDLPALPELPRASVIPLRVSVTRQLLLACDARRPNCPRRPNTLRK